MAFGEGGVHFFLISSVKINSIWIKDLKVKLKQSKPNKTTIRKKIKVNIYFGSLKWEKSSFHFKASEHFEKAEWTKGKLDKLIWLYKHVNFMKLRNTTLKTKKQTMENIYKRWILNGLCLNSDVQSCILLSPKTCSIQGLPSQLVAMPLSSHSRGQKPGVVRAPPPTPV